MARWHLAFARRVDPNHTYQVKKKREYKTTSSSSRLAFVAELAVSISISISPNKRNAPV